ncbi:MAG: cation diffusion facilitator family transporter, partial [Gammaproteobacteria bacterium]|nr:cation diffusion facilitator family transporter [Gammaproteobacteria bacterium]
MKTQQNQDKQAAIRVTLIGALLDLVLGLAKIFIGITANSIGLISDGVHSLSDLLTDGFILFITNLSHSEPDRDHPYGHRRFETLGTIALGVVLFAIASIIAFDSIERLTRDESLPIPGWIGLLVAFISIISKEWIYRYTKKVAELTNSSLLLANAWHSRTDSFSSIAVLVGIVGAMLGYPVMDSLAAIFVALMIAKIAWDLVSSSLKELVDTALPRDKVNAISAHVNQLVGIVDVHELRTRQHGGRSFVDLHVQVAPRISVSEGHFLADHISASLKRAFPDISDIVVHIDPEEDLDDSGAGELPMRADVEAMLFSRWQSILQKTSVKRVELHYLEGQIEVELY